MCFQQRVSQAKHGKSARRVRALAERLRLKELVIVESPAISSVWEIAVKVEGLRQEVYEMFTGLLERQSGAPTFIIIVLSCIFNLQALRDC